MTAVADQGVDVATMSAIVLSGHPGNACHRSNIECQLAGTESGEQSPVSASPSNSKLIALAEASVCVTADGKLNRCIL